jgi:hypothetical protein
MTTDIGGEFGGASGDAQPPGDIVRDALGHARYMKSGYHRMRVEQALRSGSLADASGHVQHIESGGNQ